MSQVEKCNYSDSDIEICYYSEVYNYSKICIYSEKDSELLLTVTVVGPCWGVDSVCGDTKTFPYFHWLPRVPDLVHRGLPRLIPVQNILSRLI